MVTAEQRLSSFGGNLNAHCLTCKILFWSITQEPLGLLFVRGAVPLYNMPVFLSDSHWDQIHAVIHVALIHLSKLVLSS